jgi:thiol-disulfide isomerase/thioredoxin
MRKIMVSVGFGLITFAIAAVLLLRRAPVQAEGEPAANKPRAAPEFASGTKWLQSKPLKLASLRGKVVVVHFWTFGCINCIHNYPAYKAWQKKYAGKDMTIIGIHTPEFEHEADAKQILAKAKKNGLKFPIAVDNDGKNWKNWNNRYWPTIYLIDKKGKVRYRWEGELDSTKTKGEQLMRKRIDELLAEKD